MLYVVPASGGQKERVAVRLKVNGFTDHYDTVTVKHGGDEVTSRRSASPDAVVVEVEP